MHKPLVLEVLGSIPARVHQVSWCYHYRLQTGVNTYIETSLFHLEKPRRLHIKGLYTLNWNMQPLFGTNKLKFSYQLDKMQRTAAHWSCRRWRNASHVDNLLDELQWPTLEAQREQASLAFFHKIHYGLVDIDKPKYLTPTPGLRHIRASHNLQYTQCLSCSDALKKFFFSPRTIPLWNSLFFSGLC